MVRFLRGISNTLCLCASVVNFSYCTQAPEGPTNPNPIAYDTPKDIYEVEVRLPSAPGETELRKHCITCHSYRYIEMQPAFPEKTWTKIVDKMVHTFGAPIPDSSVKNIVNYLVAIKGKTEEPVGSRQ